MVSMKTVLFLKSLLIFQINSLEVLPEFNVNTISKSEPVTKYVTEELFSVFKVNINDNIHFKRLFTLHNYLDSAVSRVSNGIKEIAKLTTVVKKPNIDNHIFITKFNGLQDKYSKPSIIKNKSDVDLKEYGNVCAAVVDALEKLKTLKYRDYDLTSLPNSDFSNSICEHVTESQIADDSQFAATSDSDASGDGDFWEPQDVERRIFKGTRTKIKHFPFLAVILLFDEFQCAGSIIKSDLIITAASCLQLAWNNRFFRENPKFLSVRVGTRFYNGGGETIPVLEVYFHPDYNPKNLRHNLCIMRLWRKIKFRRRSRNVKKIKLDTEPSPLSESKTKGITIVGWGPRASNNKIVNPWHNQLSFAVLDVYGLPECSEIYGREYVTKQHFCAGFISRGGGACNRDVGGPGIINGKLVGVVSFGSPLCGAPDSPTVFTKIGFYTEWIRDIMDQEVPSTRMKTTLKNDPKVSTEPTTTAEKTIITSASPDDCDKSSPNMSRNKHFLKSITDSKEFADYYNRIYKVLLNENVSDNLETTVANDTPVTKKNIALKKNTMLDAPKSDKSREGFQSDKSSEDVSKFSSGVTIMDRYANKADSDIKNSDSENNFNLEKYSDERKGNLFLDNAAERGEGSVSEEFGLELPNNLNTTTIETKILSMNRVASVLPMTFNQHTSNDQLQNSTNIDAKEIDLQLDEMYKFMSDKQILDIINQAVEEKIRDKTRKPYL